MKYLAFLVFVASVSATGNVLRHYQCPLVQPVTNFNFAVYGQGIWYEIARYPNSAERDAQCGWAEYTFLGDATRVRNYHVLNNRLKVIEGFHKQGSDIAHFGSVIATLPYGAGGHLTDNLLNILAYNNEYLIGYHCRNDASGQFHQDLAWVLSRTKNPSAETLAEIKQFLIESPLLDADKFIWPSFSDAACTVYA